MQIRRTRPATRRDRKACGSHDKHSGERETMITEGIKTALGAELAGQVEAALKGKGKDGKDMDLVVGNDGSYVPADKYNGANSGKTSAENALKKAAEALKAIGGSGDPAKIADDVAAAKATMDNLQTSHQAEISKIQKSIITQAAQMLRPGGMLLYSTCTFSPEENEQTIEYLLQEYPEFQICEMEGYEGFVNGMPQVTENRNDELKKTVRIFPHRMKGEGHFLALLQKGEAHPALPSGIDTGKQKRLPEELTSFLSHVHREFLPSRMELRGDKVYYMPAGLPSIRGIRFLRTGLLLGELKKNRFEPSQAFAMNLKMEEYDQILNLPVSDERVIKYLKGDTLDVEDLVSPKEKGWYLVCVDGYPLGFGKLINQMLKNKYLPGWRWNG